MAQLTKKLLPITLFANLNTKVRGVGEQKKLMKKTNTIEQSILFFFT